MYVWALFNEMGEMLIDLEGQLLIYATRELAEKAASEEPDPFEVEIRRIKININNGDH